MCWMILLLQLYCIITHEKLSRTCGLLYSMCFLHCICSRPLTLFMLLFSFKLFRQLAFLFWSTHSTVIQYLITIPASYWIYLHHITDSRWLLINYCLPRYCYCWAVLPGFSSPEEAQLWILAFVLCVLCFVITAFQYVLMCAIRPFLVISFLFIFIGVV